MILDKVLCVKCGFDITFLDMRKYLNCPKCDYSIQESCRLHILRDTGHKFTKEYMDNELEHFIKDV